MSKTSQSAERPTNSFISGSLRYAITSLLLFSVTLGLSCSENTPMDSGPTGPVPITVTPITGPPLTSVTVIGLDSSTTNLTDAYAYVNGSLTPLFISDSGAVRVTIPATIDSATMWVDTTITSMSLVIVNFTTGDTLAIGEDIFTPEALQPAPGSVTQMLTDWGTISTSLKTISQVLGNVPGVQEQYSTAMIGALDSLINGSDSLSLKSLTAKLNSGNPQDLALLDALFGTSGVVQQSQQYAVMLQAMADSAIGISGLTANRSAPVPSVITDRQLAFAMQFHVVIREFGRTVIAPTAQTYAIVTGAIGLVGNVPIASVISATLSVIDFIVNRYVISLLPASVDSLRINVIEDTIFVGEQVNAKVMIYAANDPQAITFHDLIAQVLNGLGLTASVLSPRELNSMIDLFTNVANYMVALLQTGVSSYASSHPSLNLDFTVTTMPALTWEAQIVDTLFVDIKTHTPTIIKPIPGQINWKADPSNTGEGRIFAATVANGATVIPQPTGFEYSGGAFGENVVGAPAVSVWSLKKLALLVDFAPDISRDGINILGVKVGSINAAGDTTFEAGFRVDLTAVGGTATPSAGFTDATGQFNSSIALDALSDTVIIHITASNTTTRSVAKDSVQAAVPLASNSRIAYVSFRDGAPGIWSVNPNDTSDIIKLCTVQPLSFHSYPVSNLFWSKDAQWLVYDMLSFLGAGIYTTSGTGLNFQRTIIDPGNYSASPLNHQVWFTANPSEFLIGASHKRFNNTDGQYICNGSGTKSKVTGSQNRGGFVSPNDQKLAVLVGCGIGQVCIVTMDATNLSNITQTTVAGPFTVGGSRGISVQYQCHGWTEDGNSVLYSKGTFGASGTSFEFRIVDATGTNDRLLSFGTGANSQLITLPTKNAFAYSTAYKSANNINVSSLFIVTLAGSTTEITGIRNHLDGITASPDGENIAYSDPGAPNGVFILNLTTKVETRLVSDSLARNPAWSGVRLQP